MITLGARASASALGLVGGAVLFCSLSLVSCAHQSPPKAKIEGPGILDLSTWDFEQGAPVSLGGPWEIYWNRFLTPQDFKSHLSPDPTGYHTLPDYWNTQIVDGKPAGRSGYATYRVLLRLPDRPPRLGLKVPIIFSAYRIWIDEVEHPSVGRPGATRQTTLPQTIANTIFFDPAGQTIQIVLQVSNFDHMWGGPRNPLLLGSESRISKDAGVFLVFSLLLAGAILMAAIMHFWLFLSRALEWSTLYFGLFCLTLSLNTFRTGEVFHFLSLPDLPWKIGFQWEFLNYYFCAFFFIRFFHHLFREDSPPFLNYVLMVPGATLALSLLFVDTSDYAWELTAFEVLVILVLVHVSVILIRAFRARRDGVVLSISGFTLFFLTVVNEILSNNDFVTIPTDYLLSLGLFFFILFQTFVISVKFAQAQVKVDRLTQELREYSTSLEAKVMQRTKDLEEAHRQKMDFFVNLAHETRTPLTLIRNYLEAYIRKSGISRELKVISDNFSKLLKDMVNYLDWEKLNRGQSFYDHGQNAELTRIVEVSRGLFEQAAGEKSMTLSWGLVPEPIMVRMDPAAVERILNNLLENAIRYGPAGTKIDITARREDETAFLTVKDQGPGIDPERMAALFRPIHHLSHKKKSSEGIGMGLSIVRHLLSDAGGDLIVTSRPGFGSEITARFRSASPLAVADGRPEDGDPSVSHEEDRRRPAFSVGGKTEPYVARVSEDSRVSQPERDTDPRALEGLGGGAFVLVVEDNDDLRTFLTEHLGGDFHPTGCRNGKEAQSLITKGPVPDLILSDVMMDEVDGHELHRWLRARKEYARIPFLFMTARGDGAELLRNLVKGVVDTIVKPFSLDELRAKMVSLLRHAQNAKVGGLREAWGLVRNLKVSKPGDVPMMPSPVAGPAHNFESQCRQFGITDRQKDIVRLIVQGWEYKEIAYELRISQNTVARHMQNLFTKTGTHNRVELLRKLVPEMGIKGGDS